MFIFIPRDPNLCSPNQSAAYGHYLVPTTSRVCGGYILTHSSKGMEQLVTILSNTWHGYKKARSISRLLQLTSDNVAELTDIHDNLAMSGHFEAMQLRRLNHRQEYYAKRCSVQAVIVPQRYISYGTHTFDESYDSIVLVESITYKEPRMERTELCVLQI